MTGAAVRPSRLRLAAVCILFASLLVAALVPIYTDEIGWRLQLRAAIDGVDTMFNDLCGPGTLAEPPWFMSPTRAFSAAANLALADPLFVRAAGVACALLWVGLLVSLTRRIERDPDRLIRTQAVLLSLLAMGVLPFLMVLSRPEQPVLLATTASILVALVPRNSLRAAPLAWAKVALILALSTVAASYHLKGVLYSVVSAVALMVCARGRGTVLPRIVGVAALAALTASSAQYWIGRFQCPGDAKLGAMLARENIAAVMAQGGSATDLALQALGSANPFNYIGLALPDATPMSNWIPPEMFSGTTAALVGLLVLGSWIGAFVLTFLSLRGYLASAGWRGLAEPRVLIAGAIFGCVVVWGASQLNKNVYEASHVLPLLLVAFALTWSLPHGALAGGSRIVAALPLAFVAFAFASQALVLGSSAGPLFRASQVAGYPDRQPFSASIADYASVRADVGQAMARSGIPAGRPLRRLLVDDLTYLALQRHRLPLHRLGVLSVWNGSIDDPVAYLRSRDSDGVVVGCDYLPPEMRAAASRSGEICAISRRGLDALARSAAGQRR